MEKCRSRKVIIQVEGARKERWVEQFGRWSKEFGRRKEDACKEVKLV